MKNLSKITVLAFAAISFTFASCGGETQTTETTETETSVDGTDDAMTTDSTTTVTTDSTTVAQ
jgi:hypothetical protein